VNKKERGSVRVAAQAVRERDASGCRKSKGREHVELESLRVDD
jgi:hypothetical protein